MCKDCVEQLNYAQLAQHLNSGVDIDSAQKLVCKRAESKRLANMNGLMVEIDIEKE